MAEQYLSDFTAPSINGNVARRILANEILKGVTQGVIETNGEGVTQRFSNDVSGAQIRIVQLMPFNQEARELGANLNGENFDGRTALQTNTNGLGVDVITVINQNIDIPQVTQDMIPVSLLEGAMHNLTMDINNNINAMTIGGKFVSTANAIAGGSGSFQTITANADGDAWRMALTLMGTELDSGDADNGIAFFPSDDRCFVFKVSAIPYILNKGILTLGGANYGYDILAKGGVSVGATPDMRDGYVGEILGTPVYKVAPLIWNLAAKYAGVAVWELEGVYGYLSSGYANVRAIAQEDQVKIIDSPDGAGIRIQPNFRMGFKSLYPKGNVFLVEEGFVNPAVAQLLTLKAPGSRPAYSADATLATVTLDGENANIDDSTKTISITLNSGTADVDAIVYTATAGATSQVKGVTSLTGLTDGSVTRYPVTVTAQNGKVVNYTLVVTVNA